MLLLHVVKPEFEPSWRFISEYAIFFAIPAGSGALPSGISSPSTLMFTGAPEVRNMSEAFFSAISFRK